MKKYFQAPWQLRDFILVLLSALTLFLLVTLGFHLSGVNLDSVEGPAKSIITTLGLILQWLIFLIPLLVLTCSKYKLNWKAFGFRKIKVQTAIKYILLGYFFYFFVSVTIAGILLKYGLEVPGYQQSEPILPMFGQDKLSLIIAGISVVFIGPLIEEILFRGFLLRTFANKFGLWWGSIASAFLFTILHYPWTSVIPIFFLALIMNYMVIRTKSVVTSLSFHIFNNSIAFTLQMLIMSGYVSIQV
jgi:uncharacterized protein